MRSTKWLPASCLLLGLVPRPAGVTPRVAIWWIADVSLNKRIVSDDNKTDSY